MKQNTLASSSSQILYSSGCLKFLLIAQTMNIGIFQHVTSFLAIARFASVMFGAQVISEDANNCDIWLQ